MAYSYIDKFHILQTIEKNDKQSILMGSKKENPKELVVINILHKESHIGKNRKGKLRKALETFIHFEKLDDGIVIVTKLQEGLPLYQYLEENLDIEHRLSIIFQYLRNIKRYDKFSDDLKRILIDESQIIMERGRLSLNELIIIGKDSEEKPSFYEIVKKIGEVTKKILFYPIENENVKEHMSHEMIKFVEGLENNQEEYKSLEEIYQVFKKAYLYAENNAEESKKRKHKIFRHKPLLKIFSGLILVGMIFYGYTYMEKNSIQQALAEKEERMNRPTAYFEKIQMKDKLQFINKSESVGKDNGIQKFLWEVRRDNEIIGTYHMKDLIIDFEEPDKYKITLKVQDKNNLWSEPYTQEINIIKIEHGKKDLVDAPTSSKEKLKDFHIEYNDEHIQKDYSIFRSGSYAIKFASKQDHPKTICIKGIHLDDQSFISMWLMADRKEDIAIKIAGYTKENIHFEKTVVYKPSKINTWDLVNISGNMDGVDEIQMKLFHFPSTIWLDDLAFDAYK